MATGYLVSLGANNSLDGGDAISGALITFTSVGTIGTGSWNWSGNWTGNGNFYSNITDTGVYYEDASGNVYFEPDNWYVDPIDTATADSPPTYIGDPTIYGTALDDLDIEGSGADDVMYGGSDTSPTGTGADTMDGGDGEDEIYGGDGNDYIEGGGGEDEIFGGDGNDTIYGDNDSTATSVSEILDWTDQGGDGTDVSGGFTQNTGNMDVTVDFVEGFSDLIEVATNTQFVDTGETFDTTSSLQLGGSGTGVNSTTTISFAATTGSDMSNNVSNVSFRLNDIDLNSGTWQDQVTVTAIDANGDTVTVLMTASGDETISGTNVAIAGGGNDSPNEADGSVLVEIAGPVQSVTILYENLGNSNQYVWVTDVHFDTLPAEGGADTIDGGAGDDDIFGGIGDDVIIGGTGADDIFGEDGNDTITFAQGDTVSGGDGDDTFILEDLGEAGTDTITITGGSEGSSDNDILQLGTLADMTTLVTTPSGTDSGALDGSVTLDDGTILNFTDIESIICFTSGTGIATPHGLRKIEDLGIGDLVVTRDNGLQPIRWIASRTVPALDRFAPVHISKHVLTGAECDLLVSPQHRMLFQGYRAELLFGETEVLVPAKHLINGRDVVQQTGGMVTYYHMMFDTHEIVFADGASSESFHPGEIGLSAVTDAAREELFALFPQLRADTSQYGHTARRCLLKHEARLLEI